MEQPIVAVTRTPGAGRRPSAALLVSALALLVAVTALGVVLLDRPAAGPCGSSLIDAIPAAGSRIGDWQVSGLGLGAERTTAYLTPVASSPSPASGDEIAILLDCYGPEAAAAMRRLEAPTTAGATPVAAPAIGEAAVAFRLPTGTFAQYVVTFRRGGVVASVENLGDIPEAAVVAVATAIDRDLEQTR